MRKLIYAEDNQMYYVIPVVFETNCELDVEQMRKISYEPLGAGRFSTSFEEFKKLMENRGYQVNKINEYPKNEIPKDNTLEIVIGATGNY